MFPEFSDQIDRLRSSDQRFASLFEKHHELDERIQRMETRAELATHEEIENLKKEKLLIKDQLYAILCSSGSAQN